MVLVISFLVILLVATVVGRVVSRSRPGTRYRGSDGGSDAPGGGHHPSSGHHSPDSGWGDSGDCGGGDSGGGGGGD